MRLLLVKALLWALFRLGFEPPVFYVPVVLHRPEHDPLSLMDSSEMLRRIQ